MPELPDVSIYQEHLERKCVGNGIERVRIRSPFVLRSVDPPMSEATGKNVREVRRILEDLEVLSTPRRQV